MSFQTRKTFVHLQKINIFLMKSESFLYLHWQSMRLPLCNFKKFMKRLVHIFWSDTTAFYDEQVFHQPVWNPVLTSWPISSQRSSTDHWSYAKSLHALNAPPSSPEDDGAVFVVKDCKHFDTVSIWVCNCCSFFPYFLIPATPKEQWGKNGLVDGEGL